MYTLITLVIACLMGFASASLAEQRGRDTTVWFVVGFLFGIVGFIILYFLPSVVIQEAVTEDKPEVVSDKHNGSDWFFLDRASKQQGPIDFGRLRVMWDDGQVNQETYVWSEGMADWDRVKNLDLF